MHALRVQAKSWLPAQAREGRGGEGGEGLVVSVGVLDFFISFLFVFVRRAADGTESSRGPLSPIEVLRFRFVHLFNCGGGRRLADWLGVWIYLRFFSVCFFCESFERPARFFLRKFLVLFIFLMFALA